MQPQTFSSPRVGSGEPGPAISELDGRCVAFVVKSYDPNSLDPAGKPKPSVTADVYVIDGGPLDFGGNYSLDPREQRAPYMRCEVPARFTDRMFSGVNIVRALRDEVGKSPVLGVVVRSDVGQRPWNFDKIPDGHPRWTIAGQFWAAMIQGQWQNPTALAIPGRVGPAGTTPPPMPGAPIPNPYAQTQQPYGTPPSGNPQQYGPAPAVSPYPPNAGEAQYAAQQPAQPPQYLTQPVPAAPYLTQPAPVQQWQQPAAPVQPAPQFMQPAPPQMQPAPAVYPDGQPMPQAPQGYEQIWPTLTREQHGAILAQAQTAPYGQAAPQGQPNRW